MSACHTVENSGYILVFMRGGKSVLSCADSEGQLTKNKWPGFALVTPEVRKNICFSQLNFLLKRLSKTRVRLKGDRIMIIENNFRTLGLGKDAELNSQQEQSQGLDSKLYLSTTDES